MQTKHTDTKFEPLSKMTSSDNGVKVVGFWVSLYTHRVQWALKLKGVEYEYIEEDIFNKSPLLTELNPVYRKVPVLVHDGKPLPESAVIVEYIDEVWSNGYRLMPQDPYERAQARFWAKFVDKVVDACWLVLCTEGENQMKAVKLAIENLENVEQLIKGKRFFGGDEIGFLDLAMGWISYTLPAWEEAAAAPARFLDPVRFPGIAAWTDNFINHPVIKAAGCMPPKAKIVEYYAWRREVNLPKFANYKVESK